MNNKGFTVIELITTFTVASAIALIFFNVVLVIKNYYSVSNIKTNLLINQANLAEQFNSISLNNDIISIDFCDDSVNNYIACYQINYTGGKSNKLIIGKQIIMFGDYTYKLDKGSIVDADNIVIRREKVEEITDNTKNSILNIKIPILNDQFPGKDFGLNYVYLFNYDDLSFNI